MDSLAQYLTAPELPVDAHLPEALVAEGQGAGRWLTDYVSFGSKASPMTPSEFHQAAGLSILAGAVARRLCLRVSTTAIYPNVYALLTAPSTLYRKSTGLRLGEDVLKAAGLRPFLLPTRMTPESMMKELTGRKPGDYEDWEKEDKDNWKAERQFAAQRMWMIEEAGSLLESFDREFTAGLLPLVLDLWDCPEERSTLTTGKGRHSVRRAYLTICGATTPAALKPHLANRAHWGNGLWARFVVVTPTKRPPWKFWPEPIKIPSSLTGPLADLTFKRLPVPTSNGSDGYEPPKPISISCPPPVWQRWEAYAKALEYDLLAGDQVPSRFNASYGRFATIAIKVALLLAAVDWAEDGKTASPEISLAHWARAQLIAESWRVSLHRLWHFAEHEGRDDNLEARVLRRIRNGPEGITSREIGQTLGKTSPDGRREIDQVLGRLKQDGVIEQFQRKSRRGPAAEAYRLANP